MKNVLIAVLLLVISCGTNYKIKDNDDCPKYKRVGAICKDGTTTRTTGSGSCSCHGGVRNWICEK